MWLFVSGLSFSHMNARHSVLRVFAKVSARRIAVESYIANSLRTLALQREGVLRRSAKYEIQGRIGADTLAV